MVTMMTMRRRKRKKRQNETDERGGELFPLELSHHSLSLAFSLSLTHSFSFQPALHAYCMYILISQFVLTLRSDVASDSELKKIRLRRDGKKGRAAARLHPELRIFPAMYPSNQTNACIELPQLS